jgi:hypothetical protein
VDIRVQAESGEEVRLAGVSGAQTVAQALQGMSSASGSPLLASLDFAYSSSNSNSDGGESPPESGPAKSSADSGVSSDVRPDHSGWNTQRASVWASLPGGSQARPVYAEREDDMRRYEDYYGDFSNGMRLYAEKGNGLLPIGEVRS